MNLLDESFQVKEEKKSKTGLRIVLAGIILMLFVIIGIVSYMVILQQKQLKVMVDGISTGELTKILVIENGTVYAPIKKVARYLGYESYNGSYFDKSEASNKCYVQCENEVANFELNSNKIYKLDLKSQASNYEYAYAKQAVMGRQGELYATSEALEKAFNISFDYDENTNTISIFTLPYLVKYYNKYVLNRGYAGLSEELPNQKAILQDMLVVQTTNGKEGVIDTNGEAILEAKYAKVTYIPEVGSGGDFFVQDNGKVGIISKTKETKIQLIYDQITLLDQDEGLYIARKDSKYGVLDLRGNVKIYIENDAIGIDISSFSENGIINKYILAGNLIPIQKDNLWGLYNLKGELVVDFQYDRLGYIASSSKNALNLLVIPDYDVLVACKNRKYTLLNKYGQELFAGAVADDIYMTISGGEKHYYITANNQTMNAEQYLDNIGVKNMTEADAHTQVQETTEPTLPNPTAEENNSGEETNNDEQNPEQGNPEEMQEQGSQDSEQNNGQE